MVIAVVNSIHYLFGLIKFSDTLSLLRGVRSINLKYFWFIAIKEAVYVVLTAYTSWQHWLMLENGRGSLSLISINFFKFSFIQLD